MSTACVKYRDRRSVTITYLELKLLILIMNASNSVQLLMSALLTYTIEEQYFLQYP